MPRRAAPLALLLAAPLLACSGPDPALVRAVRGAAAPALIAPTIHGDKPQSFLVNTDDDSITLYYGTGFTPTLTLRTASSGDLCTGHAPQWDTCTVIDQDAVRLSFEEMGAVVVRRDGTELLWGNLSFELPDEDYANHDELVEAINENVEAYVSAARKAPELSAEEFVSAVPKGKVGTP